MADISCRFIKPWRFFDADTETCLPEDLFALLSLPGVGIVERVEKDAAPTVSDETSPVPVTRKAYVHNSNKRR